MRERIEALVGDLVRLYESYQVGLSAELLVAGQSGMAATGRLRDSIGARQLAFAEEFRSQMERGIAGLIDTAVSEARGGSTMAQLPDAHLALLAEYTEDRATLTLASVQAQADKDARTAFGAYQRFVLGAMAGSARFEPSKIAAGAPYQFRDRLGRSWSSLRFIAVEAGAVCYELVNLATAYVLTLLGHEEAMYDAPGADPTLIRLDDIEGLQMTHFHPGSKALILISHR